MSNMFSHLSVGSLSRSHASIRSPRASLRSAERSRVLALNGDGRGRQPYVALVRGADHSRLPSAEMSDEEDDHDALSEDQLADKKLKAARAVGAEVSALQKACASMAVPDAMLIDVIEFV